MKASEIRRSFLDFFAQKGHQVVASSSLVPHDDPTLLFTNAGMNQFKDVFLGFDKRSYVRAATSQKCVRAGGKHNDLENVGYTARHHTFFEMLGNFSFGDYFKRDALKYAWELLTQVYKLPAEKLWVTVYAEDDEAFDIWEKEIGVPRERIVRIGDNKGARYASDNFWMMGDTGPCGPCSEIFYDHGPEVAGGPPGSPEGDGDRYIEIWNNVFMQFNRDEAGVMHKLPKPSVDTGMGLERLAAVLQHVHNNYQIDLFQTLVKAAAEVTNTTDIEVPSLKVLADHIRACAFLVSDGVIPGNAGRGYVLRRIMRRAIRHGYKLGARGPFFNKLVAPLVQEMGAAYPDLAQNQTRVTAVIREEEEQFFKTIKTGMEILDEALGKLPAGGVLDGALAFKLHDTYGFPLDLTADVCRERGYSVDEAGFNAGMAAQKEKARAAGKFKMAAGLEYKGVATHFHGYEKLALDGATVTGLYVDGSPAQSVKAGQDAVLVLDNTPFYAESGGQVGDSGFLQNGTSRFAVNDTLKIQADVFGHHGEVAEGEIKIGDKINARVDGERRGRTARNHSVTHIMHKAMREVLGSHVQQKGSLVDADKTRFDFAHNAPVTDAEITKIETIVNREIIANVATSARVMAIADAQKSGAMMLFGEKYGDEVRVLEIGSSKELCGGTHVERTGDIGFFKIYAESGVAAGIRRIEATAGEGALAYVQNRDALLADAAGALKVPAEEVSTKIAQIIDNSKALEKEIARLKGKLAAGQGDEIISSAKTVKGVKYIAVKVDADSKSLRELIDQVKNKLGSGVAVLTVVEGDKVSVIAGVTADLTAKVKAGDLVGYLSTQLGGKGGGRPDMAQGGGTDAGKLEAALAGVEAWLAAKL